MSLREAWDFHAEEWIRWVRTPGHDSYEQFHGRQFLELLPEPGHLTVDLGGGEGRLGRDLEKLGHSVVMFDGSRTLARACATHDHPVTVAVADAACVPARDGCADLVVAFMSLQDVDDLVGAIREAARLLRSGGCFCLAIVHPLNSAGRFEGRNGDAEAPFVIRGSYLSAFRFHDEVERDGLTMTFHSAHRPLGTYSSAIEAAGLVIEAMREVTEPEPAGRWSRMPLFLDIRASRR
jgi:SAM-dependent methyltransferase